MIGSSLWVVKVETTTSQMNTIQSIKELVKVIFWHIEMNRDSFHHAWALDKVTVDVQDVVKPGEILIQLGLRLSQDTNQDRSILSDILLLKFLRVLKELFVLCISTDHQRG